MPVQTSLVQTARVRTSVVQTSFSTVVTVAGMDCPHCVRSVTEGISGIAGVCAVHACLDSGAVTVLADRELARAEIAAAVDEAGYELVR